MAQAQDIVQALIERATERVPIERSTGMPYGWALWLRSLAPQPAQVHARPGEVVELLAGRPPPPPVRGEELALGASFLSLFREGWLPAPRDERPLRWTSRLGSLVLHLLFVVFLAWVAWMQSLSIPVPTQDDGGGERVAVGFVGRGDAGTPPLATEATAQVPGAPAPAADADADTSGAAASQADRTAAAVAGTVDPVQGEIVAAQRPPPPLPDVVVRPVPEPSAPAPAAEQPVQVTEVEQPTIDYVLPPTTPRTFQPPTPAPPQLREREVAVVEAPALRTAAPRPLDIPVRQPQVAESTVRVREVAEPLPQVQLRPIRMPTREPEVRLPGAPEASVVQREVAMPAPRASTPAEAPAPAPALGAAAAAAEVPASAPGATAAKPSTSAGASGADVAASPSAVPGSKAPPQASAGSGWQSPLAGDDWGQARSGEQRPGSAPGLFDGQGRVRLPGDGDGDGQAAGPGSGSAAAGAGLAGRGAPGGDSDAWSRERLEKSGTWLKRPPYGFEPTSLDRYWVPNESLLAEWVRKGLKSVAIPIPGTGKKLNCVVSLLQLGGGCGLVDPDLNDQPAQGRPPPDIPFKPGLQEENGSVRP